MDKHLEIKGNTDPAVTEWLGHATETMKSVIDLDKVERGLAICGASVVFIPGEQL